MNIGFAGPVSLDLLEFDWSNYATIPKGYPFPMTAYLVNGFLRMGHMVTVFTTSEGLKEPLVLNQGNLKICIARREPHAARDFFKSERKDLVMLMKLNRTDIISAHWSYEFALSALNSGIKTVITFHDYALKIFYYKLLERPNFNELMYWFNRLLMNYFIISKGIHFTANSEYLHSRLPHRIKQRCEIIYDFYDEHAKIFASYTPYQKKEYIVTVSNGFDFLKNVKNSLRAFKLIRDKYQSLNYCLIGDGMEAGGYAYLFAKKNNLLTGVDFLGPLKFTDVIDKIGCALINLHPSREESFGMSVLESQVLGTVVVGGIKSGNIPYLLDYGNAGYLCNIEDPEDITEKVIDCIENPVKRKDIEKKAKEVALEKYSSSKIIQQYLNLYERVISIEDK